MDQIAAPLIVQHAQAGLQDIQRGQSLADTWSKWQEQVKRSLKRNRLDRIAKAHDTDYGKAKDLKDKWAVDHKMIAKIDKLPGCKTLMECIVKNIMKAKLKLGM